MKRPNCAGVPPIGSSPPPVSLLLIAGMAITLLKASLMRLTTSAFMPAGPASPCQAVASNPGRPLSAMVGRLGALGERLAVATARARSRPVCTCGMRLA